MLDAFCTSGSSPTEGGPDFRCENHGSLFLLFPLTQSAQSWIEEHLPSDAQWFGNAVALHLGNPRRHPERRTPGVAMSSPITNLQEQISKCIREMMERRLAQWLKVDAKEFVGLAVSLSLADLLNGLFLIEGQSKTIGAYAGAIRFLSEVVTTNELFRRPEKLKEPEVEPEQQGMGN